MMNVTVTISTDRIMQLFCSAIEGGDPVTTASRGGWCAGINTTPAERKRRRGLPWYADLRFWEKRPSLTITEISDETTGRKKNHHLSQRKMGKGLAVMAKEFPHIFAQILEDEIDAPCADIFLQCCLFGEEKYV